MPVTSVQSSPAVSPVLLASSLLEEARERTLLLVRPLSEEDATTQHDPLMSPIVWDLGHLARFEELWLTHHLESEISFGEMPGLFNPFEHPRKERGKLALPKLADTIREMAEIRARVLESLRELANNYDESHPLLAGGYVFAMVLQHEYQHGETMLQTLQLKKGKPYAAPREPIPPQGAVIPPGEMVSFPGGDVFIGTDDRSVAYDNERPRHVVTLPPFLIDRTPVTNGEYLEFMKDGGYSRRELWSDDGWKWLQENGAISPKHWERDGDGWRTTMLDLQRPLDEMRPVCHVCWHEADAYARWAGKRLPTEAEWEAAATWDPATATSRYFPWGDMPATAAVANVDQLSFDTAPIGTYAANVSPIGCYGMIGDIWEWTATDFSGYPGFQAFPYREYSEVFFGPEHKVLRGGSWATRPGAIRGTFRNWDLPIRRQIFAGFRCAKDV
jgi:gamma-glutamyl hercynylcysteine S-oxide synthase